MNNQKWMKRIAAVFAAAVLAGAFAGCGGEKKADASAEARAKIGFITACTGPGAAYGTSQKEGIDMALEEINADPATKTKIDLITYDTKLVKTEAINAMKRAVTQDKVLAVIGPMTTGEFFAAGPIAQQAGVTVFGISLTADGVTDVGDYIFRNAVSGRLAIPITVKKAHDKLGFQTAAVMYSHNNDMLVSENKIYQKLLPEMGVDIVATESFADKDTDFSAQLTKIHAANPDVIVIAGFYQEGALIAKKARDSRSEKAQAFRAKFKEKYGHEPDQFAAQAYDGLYTIHTALDQSGTTTDRKKFRDTLAQVKGFEGVTGKFEFDEHRDPKMDLTVLEVKDGQWVPFA